MSTQLEVAANPFAELNLERLRRRTSAKWRYYPDDVLPLWVAEMDADIAPEIKAAVMEAIDLGDTGYPFGPRYAEALASFAADRWGWSIDTAMTAQVTDVMSGVREIVRAVSDPESPIVLTPPVYPPFFGVVSALGRTVIPARLDAEGRLDPATLETAFTEATSGGRGATLLLSNPHNPTGVVHTRAELETVARLARQYGVRVVSDEIHSPLVMPTSTLTPYLCVAGSESDFTVVSASKGWNLAGFKAALVVAGVDAAEDLKAAGLRGGGHIGVLAHTAAFNHARDWLDGAIAGIDGNRRLLADLLETHLPDARYRLPEGTYLAWIDCRELGLGDDPTAVFLEKSRVAFTSGKDFGDGGAGHVRLNLATSPAIIEEAVTRMAAVRS
ncbi:MAG TPA: aminotransferase class I/II-fold pyridoxal phosphate-dependent enzyme [Thermomicrobiales bacterium]|nr:aminotransferase class I/II-fold pyridoxal phosphate-dependent enzyme [Thermomicrobiales bacterium]